MKGKKIGLEMMCNLVGNIMEDIKLDIEVGDEIRTGKFRNKKVIVKKIGTDEHGSPTVNGKSILAIRIPKIDPTVKDKKELEEGEEIKCKCGWKWDKSEGGKDMYVCHKCGNDNSPLTEKILREANWNKTKDIDETIDELQTFYKGPNSYPEIYSNYDDNRTSINLITYREDFNVLDSLLKKAFENGYYPAAISSKHGTRKFTKSAYKTELKNNPNAILINLEKYYDDTVKYDALYHVTPVERYKALISKAGLTPHSQSKLTTHPSRVYMLTKDGETAVELAGMLYKKEKLKNKLSGEYVLLKIDMTKLPKVEVYEDPDFSEGVYTYSSIPLSVINVIDNINVVNNKELNFNDLLDMLQSSR